MNKTLQDKLNELTPEHRERIKDRAAEILKEYMEAINSKQPTESK